MGAQVTVLRQFRNQATASRRSVIFVLSGADASLCGTGHAVGAFGSQAIDQALVERFGFSRRHNSLKRMVRGGGLTASHSISRSARTVPSSAR
jgi:hypothetical protein